MRTNKYITVFLLLTALNIVIYPCEAEDILSLDELAIINAKKYQRSLKISIVPIDEPIEESVTPNLPAPVIDESLDINKSSSPVVPVVKRHRISLVKVLVSGSNSEAYIAYKGATSAYRIGDLLPNNSTLVEIMVNSILTTGCDDCESNAISFSTGDYDN